MCNVDDDEKFSMSVEYDGSYTFVEVHIILITAALIHSILYSMDWGFHKGKKSHQEPGMICMMW
jgi:hypothetical protein